MEETVKKAIIRFKAYRGKRRQWTVLVLCLSVLVAFATVSALTLRGEAMTHKETVLACGYEIPAEYGYADYAVHTHDASCYNEYGELVCPLEEIPFHEHDETCYTQVMVPVCGREESAGHAHDETCYAPVRGELICGQDGNGEHTHTDDCYAWEDGLICGNAEGEGAHQHTDGCFDVQTVLTCEKRVVTEDMLHTHDERCYDEYGDLVCGMLQLEEHAHDADCFVTVTVGAAQETDELAAAGADPAEAPEDDGPSGAFGASEEPAEAISGSAAEVLRFEEENDGLLVVVEADAGAFPAGATMDVTAVYEEATLDAAVSAVAGEVVRAQVVDIAFFDAAGAEIEPETALTFTFTSDIVAESERYAVVCVDENGEAEVVDDAVTEAEGVTFVSETTSVYAIIGTTIEKTVLASDGQTYTVSVTYGPEAGIPDGAELSVEELLADEYDAYLAKTADVLGWEAGAVSYARFFDISILHGDGAKVQPAEGTTVDVKIALTDAESESLSVVHFGDVTEVLSNTTEGDTVRFETGSFSVYAIVEAPDPIDKSAVTVTSLDKLVESEGFLISYGTGNYCSSELNRNNAFVETTDPYGAALWHFEAVGEQGSWEYKIYTIVNGEKKYITTPESNSVGLGDSDAAGIFKLSVSQTQGKFYFKVKGEDKWLQHSGSGGGMRLYTANTDAGNSRLSITYGSFIAVDSDPYDLDGKTFGMLQNDNTIVGKALMAENEDSDGLAVKEIPILENKDRSEIYIAKNDDISEWTFHYAAGVDYYVTTEVDGQTKYLTINGSSVTLEDEPHEIYSRIRVTPGTGVYKGKYRFSAGSYSLHLVSGYVGEKHFNGANSTDANVWLNLVDTINLSEEDLLIYTAHKVSVSDETHVANGRQVVVYTRVWNERTLQYEFYAIDHDGTLVRVFESGDVVQWVENSVNTILWDFTEYYNSDGTRNYYYELQNTQYGEYIAPQVTNSQILSGSTIGINLNGRRYGYDYSTIIAWDDENYQYVGLKVENDQLVPCPFSEAQDFYFAIMKDNEPGALTTVDTVDNDTYGITMRMIDFNHVVSGRDAEQSDFFGGDNNQAGLLSTNLGEDGYPTRTSVTNSSDNKSLGSLFSSMTDVNHLFIQSVYNESGYFEFDSTQNFATLLDADGNVGTSFTVYDQLAAIGTSTSATRTHGQFMPYNMINAELISPSVTNRTDVEGVLLSEADPRQGERLYLIPENQADYFFGMEMEAGFTQTVSGLDAWGHDIIFEFSGDDDFWLYVDGELVLDLGGVHSASTGTVNFRTGEVEYKVRNASGGVIRSGKTTLYELFKANYVKRGMSQQDIEAKLAEVFHLNDQGHYVFKDYSSHTMKVFYMERGAGASNLKMRFNLASVKPGTVLLEKKLAGLESASYDLVEFPYQIWYKTPESGDYQLLTNSTPYTSVYYAETTSHVTYMDLFTTADGVTYNSVFFLKPGQVAEIDMPDETIEYYVTECGVNLDVYDTVTANGDVLEGTRVSGCNRMDYSIKSASIVERPRVTYENHVPDEAVRTLSITKRLFAEDGVTQLHFEDENESLVDKTTFSFRLYLGSENEIASDLPLANMYEYCVRDGEGYYCSWNAAKQTFESLGKNVYSELSDAEKTKATFQTSMNGSISKIPADHTVEVRNLIVTTQYKVEERAWEIPKGYTLRHEDGYTRVDDGHYVVQTEAYANTIAAGEDPKIEVRNQKGWGLTVEKVWTDKDFMASHNDIYFAVYLDGKLLDGTVRRLASTDTEIYYFFPDLRDGDNNPRQFSEFIVREVSVQGTLQVDGDGSVTGYDRVLPIEPGSALTVGGTPVIGAHADYKYTVTYEMGDTEGNNNANIRTDTMTNSRPGIELYKTDLEDAPLKGAVFTMTDSEGRNVSTKTTFTSDADGLITRAYLAAGIYTLTEITAPDGCVALDTPLTVTVKEDGTVEITAAEASGDLISQTDTEGMQATIRIKNRPAAFFAKKVDQSSAAALANTHFALYKQVRQIDGTMRKDHDPMSGYTDIVSDDNGILPGISYDLGAGTYYLTETQAAPGYKRLTEDICFTIGDDGSVTVGSDGHTDWLRRTQDDAGNVSYELAIPNESVEKISIQKVDIANPSKALEGAVFDLYRVTDGTRETEPLYADLTSDGDGMLTYGSGASATTVLALELGVYDLVETAAPAGYNMKSEAVKITVSAEGVVYNEGTTLSSTGSGKTLDPETGVYTLRVSNSTGYELPHTGGRGVGLYHVLGGIMAVLGGALLLRRRRRAYT